MGKWTIHQHHYPKGKSMDPFSILELLTHEGITHFPICLRGLTLSKITTLLTHHKNNRKSFLPLQEASRCTQTSHGMAAETQRTRDSVSPSLPSKELETYLTTRTARLSPTLTPPVDEKETNAFQKELVPAPGA